MSKNGDRLKVLVIEDELSHQELYEEVLADEYNLTIVATKEEAATHVREQSFDIALVDMRLVSNARGNRDGLEVAQLIRDLGHQTIIIVKSGFPTETPEVTAWLKKLEIFATLDKSAENPMKELMDTMAKAAAEVRAKRKIAGSQA
jgi:CheY-like chemotaxis protein